jgi:hypothetical protein
MTNTGTLAGLHEDNEDNEDNDIVGYELPQ